MNGASALVDVTEVLAYLGIDYADDAVLINVNRLINTADSYLKSAVGENYPKDDPKAKEVALLVISDLYDNRGMTINNFNITRKIIDDMTLQLQLELRRRFEA